MQKYIVQSGTVRTTVQAESSHKAALWAIHQAMRQVLPIDQPGPRETQHGSDHPHSGTLKVLGSEIRVFPGSGDAKGQVLRTMDVVTEWHEMVTALDRLQRLIDRQGLAA